MKDKTASLIGATGLIGSHLTKLLSSDPFFKTIKVLVRRPVKFDNPNIRVVIIDFSDITAFESALAGSDYVFCTVGTTRKKVNGDMAAYRKVDFDIPVNAARFCEDAGIHHFLFVSSVGANSGSSNFYLKLKGEVENAVGKMNIRSISVFRPSMLLGKRQESRPAEKIGQLVRPLSFLLPSKYKPIEARDVARAMIAVSKMDAPGFCIYHYPDIMKLKKK
jgi:uncharacterized protein YbjT (DUF2867 family)